jgi:hypothetical protein
MMEFPTIVYRCPGAHWGPNGTTYESIGVNDEQQLKVRLADGWHESLVNAVDAFLSPEQPVDNSTETEDDSSITREELEQKAKELGIKFDGRTTDKKLLEKIEEALKG